jgi:translation initiation factor IF-2
MSAKVRVYEVAKELGIENRDFIQKIATLGIQVRNHMSALDIAEVDRIRRLLEKGKVENVVEERIRPTVVRRRAVAGKSEESIESSSQAGASVNGHAHAAADAGGAAHAKRRAVDEHPEPSAHKQRGESPAASRASRSTFSEGDRETEHAPGAEPASRGGVHADVAPQSPVQPLATSVAASAASVAASAADEGGAEQTSSPAPSPAARMVQGNLPPGVVARGSAVAPSAPPLSRGTVSRIVSEHAANAGFRGGMGGAMGGSPWGGPGGDVPRRRELGRAALGPVGRPQQARPLRRKQQGIQKKGLKPEITVPSAQKRVIRIEDQIQLQALAQRMSLKATDVLMKLIQLGMTNVNINSTLDADTAKILANEFNYEVENVAKSEDELLTAARGTYSDIEHDRVTRPPVVTVMGHVDHGKTSLLDSIRSAQVAQGEAGGITQHIGAYRVETPRGTIVFLDTPGHEAFTSMRARGAQATDVVILVVAADDGVMPQTKEAIHHAKAAKVPIVVAINKVDKPGAQPESVKRELVAEGLQPEDWGGDTMFVEVSAKTKQGIDQLLEGVLLQAEVLELTGNPEIPAEGVVLEAYLDKGRGPVANVLVRDGTLRSGDYVVAGNAWGRVRALTDDRGRALQNAGPATPVEVLGLSEMPSAGDQVYVVTDAKKAQEIADSRKKPGSTPVVGLGGGPRGLDQLYQMMQAGETHELRLVIKADVQGSVEAIVKALTDLSTEKVRVQVIHSGVGGITENDVMLARASSGIIVGFNVRPAGNAATVAKAEGVDIRLYSIIYEAIDEIKRAMTGLLKPNLVEKSLGSAEVRQIFNIPKVGVVAGCFVTDGKFQRSAKVRLVRDSVPVWEGSLAALRRFKDDVREVAAGYECGMSFQGFNDVKERDVVECFEMEEVAAEL